MTYVVIYEKEIVLKEDNAPLTKEDFSYLGQKLIHEEEFVEDAFGLTCMLLAPSEEVPAPYVLIPLRQYFATHDEEENFVAARAKGLLEWRKSTKFCCTCGKRLSDHKTLTARRCYSCNNLIFPRISPCIIVAVSKDNKVLLAKHTYRNQDMYACIAGFMEAGESAEHAVEREVLEETGIRIKNIKYRCSQSWPFPDQLMLGFTAEYDGGELKLQESEIADAQWFDPEDCPASPKPGSIAYKLIHGLY